MITETFIKEIQREYFFTHPLRWKKMNLKDGSKCTIYTIPLKFIGPRFSEDEELYRAKVITMDAINATVRYIDFGNVEMKPLAEVLILPEQFHSLPPFSVMINIAGLEVKASFLRNLVTQNIRD